MNTKIRVVPVLVLAAMLGGCSSALRSDAPADRIYVLQAPPAVTAANTAPRNAVLAVPRPVVAPGLDTDRIALRRAGNELDYFAASRWGESLPRVLGALAVASLQGNAGFATTLGAERAAVRSDFELLLTVRHFEAVYAAGVAAPGAQVAFDCVLVAGMPRRVLGRCDAAATQAAGSNRMSEIVAALEAAALSALGDVRAQAVALARAASEARN